MSATADGDSERRLSLADLNPETLQRIRWHRDAELVELANRILPGDESTAEQLDQRIDVLEKIVMAGNGRPLEGQKLFHDKANCGKCHHIFAQGGDVGPDLTSYDRSNIRLLLLSIVNPSAEIREGYETLAVMTDDGQMVSGFKTDENEHVLVLRGADGQTHRIEKSTIEERTAKKLSLMPTGLLDHLTDEEIRDLFAFLTSTTPPN